MNTFQEAGLPLPILKALNDMKFVTPTPIQAQALPPALQGQDILGTAQTGTGKTAAFAIPMIVRLLENPKSTALVLTPTRELATQILDAVRQITRHCAIPSVLLIGGDSLPKQMSLLKNRPRIIIGTPGRIQDHLDRGSLMLHTVCFLALDETDRMLDMGFSVQIDNIVRFLTGKRQTVMFSATLPKPILAIAAKYLNNPVRISMGSTTTPIAKIDQQHVHVQDNTKYDRLVDELEQREGSVMVFARTKIGAEKLAKRLHRENLSVDALHGGLRQNKREQVIKAFRAQKYRILVATDIASRGLDIPHVEHVINYDLPQCPEDYIHRIGRTARAGAEGSAMSLLTPSDRIKWRAICDLLSPRAATKSETRGPAPSSSRRRRSQGYYSKDRNRRAA